VQIKKDLLYIGHRLRPRGYFKKSSITIHSTGNSASSAEGERNWLDNPENSRAAAWHYIVGEGIVIQAIPDFEEAWHSGTEVGNKFSIGVEIVESGDREMVLDTATTFVASKLKELGLGVGELKRHRDWTGKICPRILIDSKHIKDGMNWTWFVEKVREKIEMPEIQKVVIIVDGEAVIAESVLVMGFNFVKLRDLAEICGFDISNTGRTPVLTKKKQ
jgi:N-acetylmuramoyl-L-alanine amidase CwlA